MSGDFMDKDMTHFAKYAADARALDKEFAEKERQMRDKAVGFESMTRNLSNQMFGKLYDPAMVKGIQSGIAIKVAMEREYERLNSKPHPAMEYVSRTELKAMEMETASLRAQLEEARAETRKGWVKQAEYDALQATCEKAAAFGVREADRFKLQRLGFYKMEEDLGVVRAAIGTVAFDKILADEQARRDKIEL